MIRTIDCDLGIDFDLWENNNNEWENDETVLE
jgi:hypothetical protein